jgi:hypothetical protein
MSPFALRKASSPTAIRENDDLSRSERQLFFAERKRRKPEGRFGVEKRQQLCELATRNSQLPLLISVAFVFLASPAWSQEAIFTRSATQPAAGVLAWRQQFRWMDYTGDMTELSTRTMLSYGIAGNLAIEAQLPIISMTGGWHEATGAGDLLLLAKTRIWQRHDSAIDTARIGVFGGAAVPLGPDALTGGGVDPVAGAVYMQVMGRHGINVSAQYQLTTNGTWHPLMPGAGEADLIRADAAYLWRIAPVEYSLENDAAWYLTLEANSFWETNGDRELLLAPGLLYEGTQIALEIGVQLPVARCVMERPAQGVGVTAGFRLLF